jgi:hypothetical protein
MLYGSDFMIKRRKETEDYLDICMFYTYYNNEGINSGHWNDDSIKQWSVYESF